MPLPCSVIPLLLGVIQIGVGEGSTSHGPFARLRQGGAALLRFPPARLAGRLAGNRLESESPDR